ncbi:Cof-type HAD-IIB family hydrolase [Thiomicrorhabdus sp.]|uniref:Cof-type HAD-IIB family hydrolase n=1 Tax=Thiomicrorhabdus sp. TaxID=2039724 RepID=UPI002AA7557C|nr:Cof-type HAD-IIB family hydrolase [Thiomicrorhabdus sp.]
MKTPKIKNRSNLIKTSFNTFSNDSPQISFQNNIHLVVSDLDGTLLNPEHKLTAKTKQAVHDLVKQGTPFMLATGRHYQDVYLIAEQIGVEMCLITSNGARVHDHKGRLLYENHMPANLVERVLELSQNFDIHRNIYQQDLWLVEEPHESLLAIHEESGFEYKFRDFSQIDLNHIDKIYFTAEHSVLQDLEKRLTQEVGDQLYITFTSPEYLEIMNLGVSKGQALQMILQQRNINAENVMALGDGMNDKEMLALVGHGVVMHNASESVKSLFPELAMAKSNAQDGVAEYLKATLLI